MKAGLLVIAVLMALTGGLFTGQGLGFIKGSFMTGDIHWFWIGLVMVVAAIVLAGFGLWRGPTRSSTRTR